MPQINEVYKCELCGNIVELVHGGPGALTCCNQKMVQLTENTTDAAQEKHVPVIEIGADKITVKVGSVAHPMLDEHYIEFIALGSKELTTSKRSSPARAPGCRQPPR
jgi:superoxide reductase